MARQANESLPPKRPEAVTEARAPRRQSWGLGPTLHISMLQDLVSLGRSTCGQLSPAARAFWKEHLLLQILLQNWIQIRGRAYLQILLDICSLPEKLGPKKGARLVWVYQKPNAICRFFVIFSLPRNAKQCWRPQIKNKEAL